MELVIFDENKNKIEEFDLSKDYDFSYVHKIKDIPTLDEGIKTFLNNLDYGVFVYSYIEDKDDFAICFLNNKAYAEHSPNLNRNRNDFLYNLVSSFDKKGIFLKYMKEVYNTNQIQKVTFKCYNNNIFVKEVNVKIMKVNDYICILGDDVTDFVFLTKEEENFFENDIMGVTVIQDKRFVKCNKKYLELMGYESLNQVIGKEIGYSGLVGDSFDFLDSNIDKIIEEHLVSYSIPYKTEIKNTLYYFNLNCNYLIYKGKPAVMIIFTDVTEQELSKKEIEEKTNEAQGLQDNLKEIQRIGKISMSYTDSEGNIDWSKSSFNVFNIDSKKYKNYHGNLLDIVIDDDLHYWEEAYAKCSLSHPEEICLLRIKNDNDKLMYIRSYIICNFDENGNELGHFTFYQDVTEEIKYQKQLETALNDKEILLSEVHHRVKNNLQIILSLINLNKNYQTDPEIILNDTETRIYAMALIHEKIYDSTSLSEVNIKDYVYALINSLFDTYWSNINFHGDIEPINLDMDYSIPLGLIVNELVTNTIKHAFPDDTEGNLYIKFEKEDKHCILTVKDDGVGLPVDFNIDNLSTLGLVVVQSLTLQIGGTINIIDTEGTEYKIEFDVE